MALNNFGLGLEFSAKDSASAAVIALGKNLGALQKSGHEANQTFEDMTGRTRDLTTGRFVKSPQGILDPSFMSQVGGTMKAASVAMLGLSASIAGGLGYALHASTEYSAAIAEVTTLTDEASFATQKMRDLTMSLADQFGGSAVGQAQALYQTISAGIGDAVGAEQLLINANKLAIGGVTDAKTATDALTNAVNTFSESNLTAAQASDAMFIAIKAGKTTAKELADTLGRVGATAAALKIPFDEMSGAVAAITTKGIVTAEAVSGLKAALAGIIKPTSDATAEAARLGIKFDAATLRAKGLPAFLDSITKSAKFNADSFGKLFGSVEALNAVQALTADSSKTFNSILDQMKNKAGATDTAFQKMQGTVAFQSNLLKARFGNAMISIGEALEPLAAKAMAVVSFLVGKFNAMSPTLKRITAYVGLAASAIFGLLGGAAGAAVAIGGLVVMGKALLVGLGLVAGMAALVVAAFIPLIAAGVTLYMLWTRNVGGIATSVVLWFSRIKLAFEAVVQALSDGAFSGAVQEELSKAENAGIKQFAINVFLWFSRIKNFFVSLGEAFSKGLDTVAPVIEKIISAVQRLAGHFGATKDAASTNKETFEKWGATGAKVGEFLVKVVEKVALGVLAVVNFVDGAVEVFNGFRPVLNALWDAAKGLFAAFSELFAAFSGGKQNAQDTADTWRTVGNVLGWVANVGITIVTAQLRVLGGIISWVAGIIGALMAIWDGLVNAIVIGVKFWAAIFRGDIGGAVDLAKSWFENLGNTIIKVFAKLIGGAAGMVDSLGKIFGKDLGLKAKVEGVATSLQSNTAGTNGNTPALPSAAGAPTATNAPGVAAAAAQPQPAPTAAAAPPVKLESTQKTQLTVDGAVLAETVQKHSQESAGRGFAPTASPT